ncbi:MAG: ABC transporter permease [Spirochaetaceae bacterium]|nr:MAG: ABC transporter permease [Spirochaetaceae bacterium]
MFDSLKSFVAYFRTYPLRGVLTILTIAIGVGALTITIGLSSDVTTALQESLAGVGRRIVIANATLTEDGSINRQFPPRIDGRVTSVLASDYENLRDVTMVAPGRVQRVEVGGDSFQIRSSVAADHRYADLMNLRVIAGSFFTAEDVQGANRVIAISESSARIMFGSATAAVGAQVQSATTAVVAQGGGQRLRAAIEPFTVVGVFEDVSDLERNAFGVGDVIVPIGTNLPRGIPSALDPNAVVMARLVNDSMIVATARIRDIIDVEYGANRPEGVAVSVWEGSIGGPAPLIEESRRSVASFALTINVLGVIILIASSIGIFSIMLVEVLNRMREIGLRRALGASKAAIRRFFLSQSIYLSLLGSAVGVVLAVVFYRAVGESLIPFFETSGLSAARLDLAGPGIPAVLISTGMAGIVGAVFGFFPALSASRTPIVECIRDEAA